MRQVLSRVWAFIGTDLLTGIVLGSAATLFILSAVHTHPWAGIFAFCALLVSMAHLAFAAMWPPRAEVVETVRVVVPKNRLDLVRAQLQAGLTLYPDALQNSFNVNNLASYISTLRKEGLAIKSIPYRQYGMRRTAYRLQRVAS